MKLDREFFRQDVQKLAPSLVGKLLVKRFPDGSVKKLRITETEAYLGTEDTACHAHKGKTPRSEILWHDGGTIYVYLCYGMRNLMNVVSGHEGEPQAVLIRCCEGAEGPGRLTKALSIDRGYNGRDILDCEDLWFEDDGLRVDIIPDVRVGIAYAEEKDRKALLRYKMRSV